MYHLGADPNCCGYLTVGSPKKYIRLLGYPGPVTGGDQPAINGPAPYSEIPTARLKVTLETRGPTSPPPPLTPQIRVPVEKLSAAFFPGVPVLPILQPGGTDGVFLTAVGIPTYGIEPIFAGPDLGHIHGLNEYVSVQYLLGGRNFLYLLVKAYADQT